MLAFLWWLSGGRSEIELQTSFHQRLILTLPGRSFKSTTSALHVGEEPPDEDDPDVELDEWDEWSDDDVPEDPN